MEVLEDQHAACTKNVSCALYQDMYVTPVSTSRIQTSYFILRCAVSESRRTQHNATCIRITVHMYEESGLRSHRLRAVEIIDRRGIDIIRVLIAISSLAVVLLLRDPFQPSIVLNRLF